MLIALNERAVSLSLSLRRVIPFHVSKPIGSAPSLRRIYGSFFRIELANRFILFESRTILTNKAGFVC